MIRLLSLLSVAALCSAFIFAPAKPKFRPPGTVEFTEGLFFDEAEISVFNWLEYQSWLERTHGKDAPEYLASKPDTSSYNHFFAPSAKHYFSHPTYRNYPVVCITYEQATDFCTWRTARVREMLLIRKKGRNSEETPCITYRLPTKEEWEMAAASPINKKSIKKAPKIYHDLEMPFNLKGQYAQEPAGKFFTAPVNQGVRNEYGMQNMFGNVAEMINQNGVAKGGSWNHTIDESGLTQAINYTEASAWLGFRCVCDVSML
ncbi:MAG: sulfatase activating formylglycine-generating enzyme [Flavobacteriales bacterium]|jgi:formylglycine-generating enzyme required for sulfatase activity